ncbi:MAG: hypothetical protein HC929_00645 [Leptolyngbyaceae cyanobacterium SM2_5_2]|nr:hypothetical protein [Leptolyngbyaceae cyanobacterium SM2_5_2]
MTLDLALLLKDHPEVVLFVLLALAYLIGRLRIGPLDLGAPPGMLIAGLIFGHLGFTVLPGIETIGLFLFLYAVAFQAGPAFFTVVLADGVSYVMLAAIATVAGFLLTLLCQAIFQFEPGVAAGLLAGSLTSPAGVAAALDTASSGTLRLPGSATTDGILSNISVSYAITFLIGDVLVLLLARGMPKLFRFDLRAEAHRAAQEKHVVEGDVQTRADWQLTRRAYRVAKDHLVGLPLASVQEKTGCSIIKLKRKGNLIEFDGETILQAEDGVAVWGRIKRQDLLDELFGNEIEDEDLLTFTITNQEVTITNSEWVGKTMGEAGFTEQYACYPTRLSRGGIEFPVAPGLVLERGDVLTLTGPKSRLHALTKQLGHVEENVNATDLVTFAAGIVGGFLIGQISLKIGGFTLGLGTAGGLLLVGILLGYLRSVHPTFGRVPPATLWVFKEMGLLFFLAGVGVEAGHGLVNAMRTTGPMILLCSAFIATLPVLAAYLYGRRVGHMNPALLLGAATGSVTCTPAMAAVSTDAKSSIPTIGYAGTYAFATVFQAIAASLMVRF